MVYTSLTRGDTAWITLVGETEDRDPVNASCASQSQGGVKSNNKTPIKARQTQDESKTDNNPKLPIAAFDASAY